MESLRPYTKDQAAGAVVGALPAASPPGPAHKVDIRSLSQPLLHVYCRKVKEHAYWPNTTPPSALTFPLPLLPPLSLLVTTTPCGPWT